MVIFTHILRSDTMAWEDILKRRRRREPDPPKDYGFKRYSGAADAARKKREAILNDPKIKEKARINRLKAKAENIISELEMSNKMIDEELDSFTTWPTKPEEHDAGIDWEKTRDAVASSTLDMIYEYEKRKAYIDFLKEAIKSNFEGIEDNTGGLYSIRSERNKFEGIEADIGNINEAVKTKYNKFKRRIGWDDMEQ